MRHTNSIASILRRNSASATFLSRRYSRSFMRLFISQCLYLCKGENVELLVQRYATYHSPFYRFLACHPVRKTCNLETIARLFSMWLKRLWWKLTGRKVWPAPLCDCECKECGWGVHCGRHPQCGHPTMDEVHPKSSFEADSRDE